MRIRNSLMNIIASLGIFMSSFGAASFVSGPYYVSVPVVRDSNGKVLNRSQLKDGNDNTNYIHLMATGGIMLGALSSRRFRENFYSPD
ncbi:MAG: hypothetical protein NT076_05645 [Candidatus Pacearchaeota archaeon]|nr:hypothetical protein [Candidatus Pacearchaeota archaeon]